MTGCKRCGRNELALVSDSVCEHFLLPATLASLDSARRWSSALAHAAAIDDDTIFELELAMTEALSNTIRHSYGEDAEQRIELSMAIDARRVELAIFDRGRPFEAAQYRRPDFENPSEGGYGVHLLDELTDELTRIKCADGSTRVTLVKYRKNAST